MRTLTAPYTAEAIKTGADGGNAPYWYADCAFDTGTVTLTPSDLRSWGQFKPMDIEGPFGPMGLELDGMEVINMDTPPFSDNFLTNKPQATLVTIYAGYVGQVDFPAVDSFYIGSYKVDDNTGICALNLINPLRRFNKVLGRKINRTDFPDASFRSVGQYLGYVMNTVSDVPLLGISVGWQSALVDDIDATTTGNIYMRYSGQAGRVSDLPNQGGFFLGDELIPYTSRTFNNPSSVTDVHNNYVTVPSAARSILAAAPGSAYGSGYAVNNILTLVGGSGTNGKVKVLAVDSDGAVLAVSVQQAGSNYVSSYDLSVTGGGGTGFKCDIAAGGRCGRARPYQQGTVAHECMPGYKLGFPLHASLAAYPPKISGVPLSGGYAWNLSDTLTLPTETLTTLLLAKAPRRFRGASSHSHIDKRTVRRSGTTGVASNVSQYSTFTSTADVPQNVGTPQKGTLTVRAHLTSVTPQGGNTTDVVNLQVSGSKFSAPYPIGAFKGWVAGQALPPAIEFQVPIPNPDLTSGTFTTVFTVVPTITNSCIATVSIDSVTYEVEYSGGDSTNSEVKSGIEVAAPIGKITFTTSQGTISMQAQAPTFIPRPQQVYVDINMRWLKGSFGVGTTGMLNINISGPKITSPPLIQIPLDATASIDIPPLRIKVNSPDLTSNSFLVTVGAYGSAGLASGVLAVDSCTFSVEYPQGNAEVIGQLEVISDGPTVTADISGMYTGATLYTDCSDHLASFAAIVGMTMDSTSQTATRALLQTAGYSFTGLVAGVPFLELLMKFQEQARFVAWYSNGGLKTRFIPDIESTTETINTSQMVKRPIVIDDGDSRVINIVDAHYDKVWYRDDFNAHIGPYQDAQSVSDHGFKPKTLILDYVADDDMALSVANFYLNKYHDAKRLFLVESFPKAFKYEQQDLAGIVYSSNANSLTGNIGLLESPPIPIPPRMDIQFDANNGPVANKIPFTVQMLMRDTGFVVEHIGFIAGLSKAGDSL